MSNKKLKESGINIHSINIDKHKNDVFRILPLLSPNNTIDLPKAIHNNMKEFAEAIVTELPPQQMLNEVGYENLTPESIYQSLLSIFRLR